MKIVKVICNDNTYNASEWLNLEEVAQLKPSQLIVLGFLVFEDSDKIILAQASSTDEVFRQFWIVPAETIIKMEILNEG